MSPDINKTRFLPPHSLTSSTSVVLTSAWMTVSGISEQRTPTTDSTGSIPLSCTRWADIYFLCTVHICLSLHTGDMMLPCFACNHSLCSVWVLCTMWKYIGFQQPFESHSTLDMEVLESSATDAFFVLSLLPVQTNAIYISCLWKGQVFILYLSSFLSHFYREIHSLCYVW